MAFSYCKKKRDWQQGKAEELEELGPKKYHNIGRIGKLVGLVGLKAPSVGPVVDQYMLLDQHKEGERISSLERHPARIERLA